MILTLICKKRELEGKKWINFSLLKGGKWYSVKFVKNCAAPLIHKIDKNVYRAFISLAETDKFDIAQKNEGGKNATVFVETYSNLSDEMLSASVETERKNLAAYRALRDKERVSFLIVDDAEQPFQVCEEGIIAVQKSK